MSQLKIETISTQILEYFSPKDDFKLIGIFGSFAKNRATAVSDIDICVATERPLTPEVRMNLTTELSLLLKKEVDLVDLQASNGVILKESFQSAIWLRKDPDCFAQILKKMLFDQSDFQPYHQKILQKKRERFFKK